jgi:hypothetical protein
LGDVGITVLDPSGNLIASSGTLRAYYAYDPPTTVSTIMPATPGFNRLGGTIQINGVNFKSAGGKGGSPSVNLNLGGDSPGSIGFDVNTTSGNQISGNVERADPNLKCCQKVGQSPCYFVTVRNPGGKAQDAVSSNAAVYILLPGPPPSNMSLNGNPPYSTVGPSLGGTPVDIQGDDMDFTRKVSIGGVTAIITAKSESDVYILTPLHVASMMAAPVVVFDVDGAAPNGTQITGAGFLYKIVVPVPVPGTLYCFVGPGEDVVVATAATCPISNCGTLPCFTPQPEVTTPGNIPNAVLQLIPTGAVVRHTDVFCVNKSCIVGSSTGSFTSCWNVANSQQMNPSSGTETTFCETISCNF